MDNFRNQRPCEKNKHEQNQLYIHIHIHIHIHINHLIYIQRDRRYISIIIRGLSEGYERVIRAIRATRIGGTTSVNIS